MAESTNEAEPHAGPRSAAVVFERGDDADGALAVAVAALRR